MVRNWTPSLSADGTNSSLFVDDTADYQLTGDYPSNALEVAFTDAADRHAAVNVAPNGSYPTDPSALTDGTIASLPSPADPNGAGTSATTASLDTDSSLKPSLSVDATNPAHVTFTVSGLEPDYSGTVTFTDASGTQDVIPIESNGAYAANLSNLTNGTITYLLSVSNPAGNVITVDPPLNLGDGSANAPAGTPQLPTLLNGYAAQPSWNVAGVDYYVGLPAGTVLKNPDTINMAGVTVDASSDTVTITGNNITLSGYDFSLNGGWQVYVAGNNDTIEDCNFAVGSNGQSPISIGVNGQTASNTTIEYNTINGNGISNGGVGLIECSGTGTTTIEYNSITNAYNEAIVLGNTTSSAANYVVQYNLIENTGEGSPEGAHGDWIQVFNSPGDTSDVEINYNTFVQNAAGDSTQGLSLQSAAITQGPVLNETVENNTMVVTGSNTINYAIIVDTTNLDGSATVSNNYIVPTGIAYGWNFFGQYNNPDGSYNGALTSFNNVDMVNGTYYPQSVTSVTQVASSPSTGSEVPGDAITLTLDFSAAVTVTGTPTLTLNDGGTATYKSGSGTGALTFSYTVGASDSDESNLAITAVNLPNGATISSGGTAANLTNALTTLWGLEIGSTSGTPPVAPVISTGVENSNASVTLTGTAPDGSTVTVSDGGTTALGTATASSTGAWSFTTADLSAGSYAFTATDTTSAGTSAASSPLDVTVTSSSTPPPAAPVISTGVENSNASVILTGTAPDGSTVTVSDGGTAALGTATASSTGAWSFTTADLSAGFYAFTATDTTSAGTSAASSPLDVTVTSSSPPPSGPNLVANGNFATGNFTDWTLGGNYTSTTFGSEIFIDTDAEGGSTYAAGMGSVGSDGTLSQTIATTAGQTYTLSFWLQNEASGSNDFTALWNGQTLLSLSNAAQSGYTEYTYTVTATGSSSVLEFSAMQDPSQWDLDNISLTANSTTTTPPPDPTVIQTDTSSFGSTSLTEVGNNYFLYNSSGSGPELKYNGADVVAGQFGAWTPIGAVQTASGYDVAWELPGANEYTVWTTDSNGNELSYIGVVSGNSTALESFAPIFGQDLNGGGVTGTPTVIQTDTSSSGTTSLTQVWYDYFLDNSSGSGAELKYNGADVVAGQFGAWTPIGAVQTASGYDVAWELPGANEYTVWNTDSNGNELSYIGIVSGNSTALEPYDAIFGQDLSGAGVSGVPTVIQTDTGSLGATSLTQVWYNYFLDNSSGSGPELKYNGADVVAGQWGGWVPIGAVQTASGYDVAWEIPGANEYTVWSTDSNGNFLSYIGVVSGNSTTLESYESIFDQNLNGDGVIGLYAAPGTTLQISAPLADPSGSATIGAGAKLELAVADSGSVTFASSTGTLILESPSTFSGEIFNFAGNGKLSGSDQIDLTNINFNSVKDSYANGVLTVTDGTNTDKLDLNGSYKLANFDFASDGSGGTIVYDPPAPTSNALAPTSSSQTITASEPPTGGSATIGTGATLELGAACSEAVTFSGPTGTLVLGSSSTSGGQSSNFTGTVSGFGAQDVIDLPGIAFDAQTTLGYLADSNQTGGTLSLTDGAQSAKIALLGNYMASSFAVASDNHGGTMITEASQASNQALLTNPQHT